MWRLCMPAAYLASRSEIAITDARRADEAPHVPRWRRCAPRRSPMLWLNWPGRAPHSARRQIQHRRGFRPRRAAFLTHHGEAGRQATALCARYAPRQKRCSTYIYAAPPTGRAGGISRDFRSGGCSG
jgi:hypothetical protein